jgi:hypothetical protein
MERQDESDGAKDDSSLMIAALPAVTGVIVMAAVADNLLA